VRARGRSATALLPLALVLMACTDQAPTETAHHKRDSQTISVSAVTRVMVSAIAPPELEVSASLLNGMPSLVRVAVGEQCPLFVRIFPDPTGEYMGALNASMACAPGGPALDLAPGDSAVLTRVLGADTLASFAPGRYGVNVAVTTDTYLIGVWAGTVQLPLALSR
jgi:hypothetical protein